MTLTPLESRESPVALLWQFDADPWFTPNRRARIVAGGEALASLLDRDGVEAVTVRVTGGAPAGTVAAAWQDSPTAGRIAFNTTDPTDADLEWVAAHETGHVLGIGHVWQPGAVMHPIAPREDAGPVVLHGADVAAAELAGWRVEVPKPPPADKVFMNPYGKIGWQVVPAEHVAAWEESRR